MVEGIISSVVQKRIPNAVVCSTKMIKEVLWNNQMCDRWTAWRNQFQIDYSMSNFIEFESNFEDLVCKELGNSGASLIGWFSVIIISWLTSVLVLLLTDLTVFQIHHCGKNVWKIVWTRKDVCKMLPVDVHLIGNNPSCSRHEFFDNTFVLRFVLRSVVNDCI